MNPIKKYDRQLLKGPNKKELKEIRISLSSWNDIEGAKRIILEAEQKYGQVVNSTPSLKIVRECRHAVNILSHLASSGAGVKSIKMNAGETDWPDFWFDLNGDVIPCELVSIHDPEPGLIGIPIDERDGNLVLDASKDYSDWPEDKFLVAQPHLGRWNNAVTQALRGGDEIPLGIIMANVEDLHEWVVEAVHSKNEKAKAGNYVEGTVLVIATDFPMMHNVPPDFLSTIHPVLDLGSLFRAIVLHVENWPVVIWDNPRFRPIGWNWRKV